VLMQEIAEEYEQKKDRIEKVKSGKYDTYGVLGPLGSAPLIRTPCVAIAIRGTKLLVFENETKGTRIIVLEGTVDVKTIKEDEIFSVDAGYRIRASKDGVISNPEKIDLMKIKRWWER